MATPRRARPSIAGDNNRDVYATRDFVQNLTHGLYHLALRNGHIAHRLYHDHGIKLEAFARRRAHALQNFDGGGAPVSQQAQSLAGQTGRPRRETCSADALVELGRQRGQHGEIGHRNILLENRHDTVGTAVRGKQTEYPGVSLKTMSASAEVGGNVAYARQTRVRLSG